MAKKEQEQTTDMIPVVAETKDIKSLIYVVRGQQVMLDSNETPGRCQSLIFVRTRHEVCQDCKAIDSY